MKEKKNKNPRTEALLWLIGVVLVALPFVACLALRNGEAPIAVVLSALFLLHGYLLVVVLRNRYRLDWSLEGARTGHCIWSGLPEGDGSTRG